MNNLKMYRVLGIMTGTSMDGIDISLIQTNGNKLVKIISEKSYQYSKNNHIILKNINKKDYQNNIKLSQLNIKYSNLLIKFIHKFLKEKRIKKNKLDLVSISGQTIIHDPKNKISIQIGCPQFISNKLKLKVASNFRSNDLKSGGQGAPIGSFYHKYLINKINKNSLIINLGGVANFALLYKNILFSSDIGPANAISDDLMLYFFNKKFDKNGFVASNGKKNKTIINKYKNDTFFKKKYPKSLDRNHFHYLIKKLMNLKPEDALCTAIHLTIYAIIELLKEKICSNINEIIITGGGRKNKLMIQLLKTSIKNININVIDKYKLNGDLIEAQMFAYIGVRSLKKNIISLPTTTGVKKGITGGRIYKPNI